MAELQDNEQNEQASFRQQSIDNVFNQFSKPFFVHSPPNITTYTVLVAAFLCFIIAVLIWVKLPVHVRAVGEIIAGKDYHQIVIDDVDKIVSKVLVNAGQLVSEGDLLFELQHRDTKKQSQLENELATQITSLQLAIEKAEAFYKESVIELNSQKQQQLSVLEQIRKTHARELEVLERYKKSVREGLISATLVDEQNRIVSALELRKFEQQAIYTSLELDLIKEEESFQNLATSHASQIEQLQLQIQRVTAGLELSSPCNCTIDNIFIEQGLPVIAGQSIATLSNLREMTSLVLYIPANQYRTIAVNDQIQVRATAYSSSKYGALIATIDSVSNSPVPGNMTNKPGLGLQEQTYFIVTASITKQPANVSLVTGMTIESDIVVDRNSLFDVIFDSFSKT